VLALGRVAVGVDEQIVVAVVHALERRTRVDANQPASGHVLTLRRLAKVHRQRPREDDEGLFLERMLVAASLRARLVAPDVRARVGEAGQLAQLGDVAWRFTGLVRTRRPLELVGTDDAERHAQ
jgi:hypothetical protein